MLFGLVLEREFGADPACNIPCSGSTPIKYISCASGGFTLRGCLAYSAGLYYKNL